MLKKIGLTAVLAAAVLAGAHIVFRPPPLEGRTVSAAVAASSATPLGKFAVTSRPNESSAVAPLLDGPEAFAARVALIREAEVALDVQYYIWQRDATGLILLDELRKAAGRGVRVRLLLDETALPASTATWLPSTPRTMSRCDCSTPSF